MENQNPSLSPKPDFQPILSLLSLSETPLVKDMTDEQLAAHINRIRSLATNSLELSSQLKTEAAVSGKPNSKAAKKQSLLDSI